MIELMEDTDTFSMLCITVSFLDFYFLTNQEGNVSVM